MQNKMGAGETDPEKNAEFTSGDRTFRLGPDGSVNISSKVPLKGISIENIAELKSYSISRENNRIMHVFEFWNGGAGELTFSAIKNSDGTYRMEICEFGEGIISRLTSNGFLVVSPNKQKDQDGTATVISE